MLTPALCRLISRILSDTEDAFGLEKIITRRILEASMLEETQASIIHHCEWCDENMYMFKTLRDHYSLMGFDATFNIVGELWSQGYQFTVSWPERN